MSDEMLNYLTTLGWEAADSCDNRADAPTSAALESGHGPLAWALHRWGEQARDAYLHGWDMRVQADADVGAGADRDWQDRHAHCMVGVPSWAR
jgi:hypothetical protein